MYRVCAKNNVGGLGPDLWNHICKFTGPVKYWVQVDKDNVTRDIETVIDGSQTMTDIIRTSQCPGWVRIMPLIRSWYYFTRDYLHELNRSEDEYWLRGYQVYSDELSTFLTWRTINELMITIAFISRQ